MRPYLLFLSTALFLLPMASVEAHHSASSFWHIDRTTVIEGVVKAVAFQKIEQARSSNVSLMPEGLDKVLKPEEIADLVAYLKASKPRAESFNKR